MSPIRIKIQIECVFNTPLSGIQIQIINRWWFEIWQTQTQIYDPGGKLPKKPLESPDCMHECHRSTTHPPT
jgi:hypothetical protein